MAAITAELTTPYQDRAREGGVRWASSSTRHGTLHHTQQRQHQHQQHLAAVTAVTIHQWRTINGPSIPPAEGVTTPPGALADRTGSSSCSSSSSGGDGVMTSLLLSAAGSSCTCLIPLRWFMVGSPGAAHGVERRRHLVHLLISSHAPSSGITSCPGQWHHPPSLAAPGAPGAGSMLS